MLRSWIGLIALVATTLPLQVARAEGTDWLKSLPAESLRLPNGLRVLLAPDPQARLVSVRVDYQVGSSDDPAGLRGLAHLTEHLVASHTLHDPAVLETLGSLGAVDWNATTSLDTTSYFETVPPERLDRALWIEAERMGFAAPALTADRVRSELAAVRNEIVQTRVNRVLGTLPDITFNDLFPRGHPYSDPRTVSESDDLTESDARAFLASYYVPKNAVLAIAGRFDRAVAVASIERYFGPLSSAAPVVRPPAPEVPMANRWLVLGAPIITPTVGLAWRTPPRGTPDDAALDLLAIVLSGPDRLGRSLRDAGLAHTFWAGESSYQRASVFEISAEVAPGVNSGAVLAAIERTVNEVAQAVTPGDLDRARKLMVRQAHRNIETTWSRAATLSSLASIGIEPGPGFDWGLARHQAVATPELAQVARRWLSDSPRIVTVIQPDRNAGPYGVVLRRESHP